MTVTVVSQPFERGHALPKDRLDPECLAADATWLLDRNDPHELVTHLLKQVRENDDRQNSIRDGYSASYRLLDEIHRDTCYERNEMREALRAIKHAIRHIKVGRP